MRRNPYYLVREIKGKHYLLPFGQSIAKQFRGLQVNETGILLWELLSVERTIDTLTDAFAVQISADPEFLPELKEDICTFIHSLNQCGALIMSPTELFQHGEVVAHIKIAGLALCLEGSADYYSPAFDAFITNDAPAESDMHVHVTFQTNPHMVAGTVLLHSELLSVVDYEDYFLLLFNENTKVHELLLAKDGTDALFYCDPPCDDVFREELFHAIREAFLYLASLHNMVALHSASVLYKGQAWLFSGRSGTGKSTHAALWHDNFDTPYINGDLNLIGFEGNSPVVYGIPWCGTSGISSKETYPLGGIVLLKQAKENRVESLSIDSQILLVDQRLISHTWTPELFDANLCCIEKAASQILICRLNCTKEKEAAQVMKDYIDQQLS